MSAGGKGLARLCLKRVTAGQVENFQNAFLAPVDHFRPGSDAG